MQVVNDSSLPNADQTNGQSQPDKPKDDAKGFRKLKKPVMKKLPPEEESFIGFKLKPTKKAEKAKADTVEEVQLKGFDKTNLKDVPPGEEANLDKFKASDLPDIPPKEKVQLEVYEVCLLTCLSPLVMLFRASGKIQYEIIIFYLKTKYNQLEWCKITYTIYICVFKYIFIRYACNGNFFSQHSPNIPMEHINNKTPTYQKKKLIKNIKINIYISLFTLQPAMLS